MKILPLFFGIICLKICFDVYPEDIKGPEQMLLAIITSFLSGMFFGEYLLLHRQKKYFCGEIEDILNRYNELFDTEE